MNIICPICRSVNRIDSDICYYCGQDLKLIKATKGRALNHFNRAVEFAEKKEYEKALEELTLALELDKEEPSFFLVMGTIYAKLNQLDKAKECWEKGISLDPKYKNLHENLIKLGGYPVLSKIKKSSQVLGLITVISIFIVFISLFAFISQNHRYKELLEEMQYLSKHKTDKIRNFYLKKIAFNFQNQLSTISKKCSELDKKNLFLSFKIDLLRKKPFAALKKLKILKEKYNYLISNDNLENLKMQLTEYLNNYFQGEKFEKFYSQLKSLKEKYSSVLPEYFDNLENSYKEKYLAYKVSKIATFPLKTGKDFDRQMSILIKLEKEYGKSKRIENYKKYLKETFVSTKIKEIETLIAKNNYDKADEMLNKLKILSGKYNLMSEKEIKLLQDKVSIAKHNFIIKQFIKFYKEKKWQKAYNFAEEIRKNNLSSKIKNFDKKLTKIKINLVWTLWKELHKKEQDILRKNIKNPEDIVNKCSFILENLTKRLTYIKDDVLYYRAMAYLKMGKIKLAKKDLENILKIKRNPYKKLAQKNLKKIEKIHKK